MQRSTTSFPFVVLVMGGLTYLMFNVVNDDFEEVTIKAILEAGATGQVGDGKIFVSDITECYRIRTGEKGGETLN